jgi:predicted Fe-S protein YdhL (DUF1289 family)
MENDICLGCGRTLEQIAQWLYITDEEREQVLDQLKNNETYSRNQRGLS